MHCMSLSYRRYILISDRPTFKNGHSPVSLGEEPSNQGRGFLSKFQLCYNIDARSSAGLIGSSSSSPMAARPLSRPLSSPLPSSRVMPDSTRASRAPPGPPPPPE